MDLAKSYLGITDLSRHSTTVFSNEMHTSHRKTLQLFWRLIIQFFSHEVWINLTLTKTARGGIKIIELLRWSMIQNKVTKWNSTAEVHCGTKTKYIYIIYVISRIFWLFLLSPVIKWKVYTYNQKKKKKYTCLNRNSVESSLAVRHYNLTLELGIGKLILNIIHFL